MPNLSEDDYATLQDLLKDPSLSDETRQRVTAAVEGFEQQQAPTEGQGAAPVDPSAPIVPQVLAQAPATNNPGGDEAAASEWLANPGGSKAGAVFFYEPPLSVAKQKLAQNPQMLSALGFEHIPPTPEAIAQMTRDSDIYRAYADYEWNNASQQATKAGRAAYRYAKSPWLHGGNAIEALQNFGMKAMGAITPAADAVDTFIMGVDDTMTLGAAGGAIEAVAGDVATQDRARLREEHPAAELAGQVAGALSPWGATARMFNATTAAGKALVGAGAGVGKRMLASGGAAAVAGAGLQAGKEGVQAASGLAQGEDVGPQLESAPGRLGAAAVTEGLLGGGLEGVGTGVGLGASWVNRRFQGLPQRIAEQGIAKFSAISGIKLSPQTQELIQRAEQADLQPGDMLAREIAPAIKNAADQEVKGAIQQVTSRKDQFFGTREGQLRLPAQNLVNRSLEILRRKHDAPKASGGLRSLDVSGAPVRVKRILNSEIADVSTKPVKGALPVTPEEAESFLATSWKKKLVSRDKPRPKASAEYAGGAREVDLAAGKYSLEGKTLKDLGHRETQAEKLDAVRKNEKFRGGKVEGDEEGISLIDDPELGLRLNDGRHRFTVAKERGDSSIFGTARDPESGEVLFRGDIPLSAEGGNGDLVGTLKRRGVDKVYLVPRRHDARSHEEVIKGIKGFRQQNKGMRELQELDEAARIDRDARPLGGKPGGWSALQGEHEQLIGAAKNLEKLVSPSGDPFKTLAGHGNRKPGELLTVEALRRAADKGGVRQELETVRNLDPLMRLRERVNWGRGVTENMRSPLGPAANIDAAAMRAYPALRKLGAPDSVIRGGMGGRFSTIGPGAPVIEEERQ